MTEIKLDLYEMQSASHLGILRCLESIRLKQEWGYGLKASLNEINVHYTKKDYSLPVAFLKPNKYIL